MLFLYKTGKITRLAYNRYRNMITEEIRTKRKNYYANKIDQFKNSMKDTWGVINELIKPGSFKRHNDIKLLDEHGSEISDPVVVANNLNGYFCSIGQQISNSFSSNNRDHLRYLSGNHIGSFFFSPVIRADIDEIIYEFENKSCNINNLPIFVLKKLSYIISPILAEIINKSLVSGIFPNILKKLKLFPCIRMVIGD